MATVAPFSLSPSCKEEGCYRHHWTLENGQQFHEGLHLFIKGWDSFEVCPKKVAPLLEQGTIPWPRGAKHPMIGALDLRIVVLKRDRLPFFFDYATEKFPEVVAKLQLAEAIGEYAPKLLQDAENLLGMQDGV